MIFIKDNVPSSKNSKVWTGKYFVWSKAAQLYVRNTKLIWISKRLEWLELTQGHSYPIKVSFKFMRKSKHKFDYVNPLQTVLDLMVKYKWISDDNADVIIRYFEPYEYDKENPGVFINILN